jgi:hypothetical protein
MRASTGDGDGADAYCDRVSSRARAICKKINQSIAAFSSHDAAAAPAGEHLKQDPLLGEDGDSNSEEELSSCNEEAVTVADPQVVPVPPVVEMGLGSASVHQIDSDVEEIVPKSLKSDSVRTKKERQSDSPASLASCSTSVSLESDTDVARARRILEKTDVLAPKRRGSKLDKVFEEMQAHNAAMRGFMERNTLAFEKLLAAAAGSNVGK